MQHNGISWKRPVRLHPSAPPPNQQAAATADKWPKSNLGDAQQLPNRQRHCTVLLSSWSAEADHPRIAGADCDEIVDGAPLHTMTIVRVGDTNDAVIAERRLGS
jgi:hypothetical protein